MTDAKTGITAKLVVGNVAQWAKLLRTYLMARGLCKYGVEIT